MDPARIAIVGELAGGESPALTLPDRYAQAVWRAGGLPWVAPPPGSGMPDDAAARLLDGADGLLFSGGDDFDAEALGIGPTHEKAKPVPAAKQAFDLALAREAIARGLPTLGVCYGMQLLALAEGARLHQHLPEDRPGSREHAGGVRHEVLVEPDTKLAAILEVSALEVISRHHQAIALPGSGWTVSARDGEGLIEALEREGHPFCLGVQWHPELAANGGVEERLFSALVEAALRHGTTRSRAVP